MNNPASHKKRFYRRGWTVSHNAAPADRLRLLTGTAAVWSRGTHFLFTCAILAPLGLVVIGTALAQGTNPQNGAAATAQTGVDINVGTASASNGAAIGAATVEKQWIDFLQAEGKKHGLDQFIEGSNALPDGHLLVYQSGVMEVNASIGDPRFIAARNAAFESSELQAKQKLAEFVSTELRSSRGLKLAQDAGEQAPPMLQQALAPISIVKKAAILTDKALDEQIKQFDPKWDGTGKTPEEKDAALVKGETKFRSNIAANARLFTSGAFTIANFEGLNEDGKYAVLAGIIWSPRLANVATSIYSPGAGALPGAAGGPTLKEQLDAMSKLNPDTYAVSGGARVWRDENGHFSIVAFGSAPASSISAADRDRATLKAKAFIQQFVGEEVETGAEVKDAFAMQDTTQGTRTFDESSYHRNINAQAKSIALIGAFTLGEWRGEHPAGKTRMQVVVVAWSPTSAQTAAQLSSTLQNQQQNMQSQSGNLAHGGNAGSQGGAIVAPVRSGASANSSDF